MAAKAVPRVLPTPAEQEESKEEVCAPVKVRPCSGCTNSKSAITQKESVVTLDSEEDISETNTDASSDSDTEIGEEDSAEQGSRDPSPHRRLKGITVMHPTFCRARLAECSRERKYCRERSVQHLCLHRSYSGNRNALTHSDFAVIGSKVLSSRVVRVQ